MWLILVLSTIFKDFLFKATHNFAAIMLDCWKSTENYGKWLPKKYNLKLSVCLEYWPNRCEFWLRLYSIFVNWLPNLIEVKPPTYSWGSWTQITWLLVVEVNPSQNSQLCRVFDWQYTISLIFFLFTSSLRMHFPRICSVLI